MSAQNVDGSYNEQNDSSYATKRNEQVPVVKDSDIEDPIDANTADSDAQLERDDREAIDKDNVINQRTRGAKVGKGAYADPDEDDLPSEVLDGNNGRSAVSQ
ncbi:hypothetical protein BT63DRAFT_414861 [Microthyrium microscopicum]|uniref:Histone chaperone domain-containing protein n=1 Tax=Microthyrium microscopicum TaxID=703497 RepID=A0A6A6U6Q3_9PEZI|nr:hypothetical protein BT63DRAFT_414861 [Microthyrium microscopicum]